jgi:hypothetical protein
MERGVLPIRYAFKSMLDRIHAHIIHMRREILFVTY